MQILYGVDTDLSERLTMELPIIYVTANNVAVADLA